MTKLHSNKGITLMAEVITVILMTIILGVISYSSLSSLDMRDLNNMYNDIIAIQEKAINYYYKNIEAPVDKTSVLNYTEIKNKLGSQQNVNDEGGNYYKIDFSKLSNITLNIAQTNEDYYFMNDKTLTTYYSSGIEIDDLVKYTIPSNYEGISLVNISIFQNEN